MSEVEVKRDESFESALRRFKKKIEQDALQGPRLSFVGEYLREKIGAKKFLP